LAWRRKPVIRSRKPESTKARKVVAAVTFEECLAVAFMALLLAKDGPRIARSRVARGKQDTLSIPDFFGFSNFRAFVIRMRATSNRPPRAAERRLGQALIRNLPTAKAVFAQKASNSITKARKYESPKICCHSYA
jgi:hypothetical protein